MSRRARRPRTALWHYAARAAVGVGLLAAVVGYALDARDVATLGLERWQWQALGNATVIGSLGWMVFDQHHSIRLLTSQLDMLRDDRAIDLLVDAPALDHDWYHVEEGPEDTWLTLRVPTVLIVNRSRTQAASLRWFCHLKVHNFESRIDVDAQTDHTRSVNGKVDPIWLGNPLNLEPQSSRCGNLLLAVPFEGRRWTTDGVLLLSEVVLALRDEQTGEQFELAVPGRHETRHTGSA